ncbi:MAG: SPOR domain-containing protein [Treponema sp.]|jgi:DedD protein|nr:SPOR domain-containing protein [Treponema sp.]
MEKRKLLLVAVSVGVFLVIVLSAAILIFTPSGEGPVLASRTVFPETAVQPAVSSSPAAAREPASVDAADIVRNPGEIQGLMVPPSANVSSPGTETPDPAAPASTTPIQGTAVVQENNSADANAANVVISVPKPATPEIPVPQNKTSSAPVSPAKSVQQKTAASAAVPAPAVTAAKPETPGAESPARQTPAGSGAKTAAETSSPVPARPTPAAPAKSTAVSAGRTESVSRSVQDYWIQTGAFSAMIRAESAKENLAAKGLNPVIDNREVDGQIWYRVRIGPYTSENEANYWLALVRAVDGFAESQVRSTQR